MKKILFTHSSNEMYGADRVLLNVVDSLEAADDVKIVVWLPEDLPTGDGSFTAELRKRGIECVVLPMPVLRRADIKFSRLGALAKSIFSTWRQLRYLKPEVVYCSTSAMVLVSAVARFAGINTVLMHCQEMWRGAEGRILGLLSFGVTTCICISQPVLESTSGFARLRARVILNGHKASPAPAVSLQPEGPLTFLVASRWNSWKGHKTLLSAWDTESPIGRLLVLGGPPPSGLVTDVQSLVANLRNPSSVEVIGEVPSIGLYMDAVDFVIVPSDEPEPFGLIAIEAFSRSRAVIASAQGGLGQIIDHEVNGLKFENKDVDSLRTALVSVSKADATTMGSEARHKFEEMYSMPTFRSNFRKLWNDVGI